MAAQRSECAQTARQDDNLLAFPGAAERVEHALDPVVVTIDERIVEDDRNALSSLGKHRRHRQPHQNGDLFLRTVGQLR